MEFNELRITKHDMNAILLPDHVFTYNAYTYFTSSVVPKFEQFRTLVPANHSVDPTLYDIVFAIGDIHADFRKLLQILSNLKIITLPNGLDPYTDDIYNVDIISNTTWNKHRTLVVLVGDLVDGSRGLDPRTRSQKDGVDDPKGSFEFLLHCFLYNIRLSAKQHESEVMFTMGNHDLRSVFIRNGSDITILYDYVHPTTWMFLDVQTFSKVDQRMKRRLVLQEFYKNCPYGILLLENDTIQEAAFVHGGFHAPDGTSLVTNLLTLQQDLNIDLDIETFTKELYKDPNNVLETRYYSESTNPNLCSSLNTFPYKKIIVGHCPTGNSKSGSTFDKIYTTMHSTNPERYTKCKTGTGCVLLHCKNPQIAFTDVALSAAFLSSGNKNRGVEVLVLLKNTSYQNGSNDTYYTATTQQATKNTLPSSVVSFPNTTPPFSSNYLQALEANLNNNSPGFLRANAVRKTENNANPNLKRERIRMAAEKRMLAETISNSSKSFSKTRKNRKTRKSRKSRKSRKNRKTRKTQRN
jgi:hypothetical protein